MEAAIATSTTRTTAILILLFISFISVVVQPSNAEHNISEILSHYPKYSLYNSYLSQTKVSDEINSRETVTCLVLPNTVMSDLAAKRPLSAVKNALRLLTLLDYYDSSKLHAISGGTVQITTLLQTTGSFQGNLGFVNVTDLRAGKVGFGSTYRGSRLNSTYTKSVKQLPYSISVLEVSAPIVFPGLLDAPARTNANITALLDKAECKTFLSLLASSGVLKRFQDAMDKGLTVFAPNDEAFNADAVPDLTGLSQVELVTLLQYHAIPEYAPKATLKATKGSRLTTLATGGTRKYDLSVASSGDDISLNTGLDSSRVASTVIDDPPFCILIVDNVLLPMEMFGKAPAPAPAPAPGSEKGPAAAPTPTPTPSPSLAPSSATAPAPGRSSPPVSPPSESPEFSPTASPDAAADDVQDLGADATRPRDGLVAVTIGCIVAFVSAMSSF